MSNHHLLSRPASVSSATTAALVAPRTAVLASSRSPSPGISCAGTKIGVSSHFGSTPRRNGLRQQYVVDGFDRQRCTGGLLSCNFRDIIRWLVLSHPHSSSRTSTVRADDAKIVDAVVHRVDTPADSAASLPVSCTNTSCPCNAPNFCEADTYFTTCCTANFNCKTPVVQ